MHDIYICPHSLFITPLLPEGEESSHLLLHLLALDPACVHVSCMATFLIIYVVICLYIRVCFHHFTSHAHDYVLTPLLPEGNEVAYVSYFLAARLIALISDGECNSRRRRSLMYACLLARCVCNVCRVIHLHYTACTLYAGIQLEIFECHSRTPSSHR
jgi:hypothetical protein